MEHQSEIRQHLSSTMDLDRALLGMWSRWEAPRSSTALLCWASAPFAPVASSLSHVNRLDELMFPPQARLQDYLRGPPKTRQDLCEKHCSFDSSLGLVLKYVNVACGPSIFVES